jgi:hypothetical protein
MKLTIASLLLTIPSLAMAQFGVGSLCDKPGGIGCTNNEDGSLVIPYPLKTLQMADYWWIERVHT